VASIALVFGCETNKQQTQVATMPTSCTSSRGPTVSTTAIAPILPLLPIGSCGVCARYGAPKKLGVVDAPLDELSGLAASRTHADVYYTHNDSGDSARFFAIRSSGRLIAEINIANEWALDIEEIAVGPCPNGQCVYVADIGDNLFIRPFVAIHRIDESTIDLSKPKQSVDHETFRFYYPDSTHDAEAILVHPSMPLIYVISKDKSGAQLYRGSLDNTSQLAPLVHVGAVHTARYVTAASVHPSGNAVILRSIADAWQFSVPDGTFESIVARDPDLSLAIPGDIQGEAIAYTADGCAFLTSSEGVSPPVFLRTCAPTP
jgi:hypothetical protein